MATTIRELLVSLGVEADSTQATGFDDALQGVTDSAQKLIDILKYVVAGAAAVGAALTAQGVATASAAKAITEQARSLGLTTDAYQELTYATGKYGVQADDLADAFGQISQLSRDAAAGSGEVVDRFAALGITTADLVGLSPEQLFLRIADGIAATDDATTRLALSSSILGEDLAKKLGPMLIKGAAGVEALRLQAHELGVVLDEEALAAGVAFSAELGELGGLVTSVRNEIGLAMIPVLSELVRGMITWVRTNRELISTRIDAYITGIGEAVADARAFIEDLVADLGGTAGLIALLERLAVAAAYAGAALVAFRALQFAAALWKLASSALTLGRSLAPVIGQLGTLGSVLFNAARLGVGPFLAAVGAALTPLGAFTITVLGVVAAMSAQLAIMAPVLLLIEDLHTFIDGGDSIIGRFAERFRDAEGAIGGVARVLLAFRDNLNASWALVDAVATLLVALGEAAVNAIGRQLVPWIAVARDALAALAAEFEPLIALGLRFLDVLGAIAGNNLNAIAAALADNTGDMQYLTGLATAGAGAVSAGDAAASAAMNAASFAPSPSTYAGAGTTTSSTSSMTVAGNTYAISGVGMSKEEALELIRQSEQERARAQAAALAGGDL